jgi:hypothetical protein
LPSFKRLAFSEQPANERCRAAVEANFWKDKISHLLLSGRRNGWPETEPLVTARVDHSNQTNKNQLNIDKIVS